MKVLVVPLCVSLETGDDGFKIRFKKSFADGGRIGFANGNGVADEDAEKAALGKRVRELMDEGFDIGEAVKKAMSEGYAEGGRIGFNKGGGFLKSLFSGVKPDGGITNSILKNKYHPILSSLNTMELYDLLGMIPFEEGGRVGFSKGKLALADAARRKFMKSAAGIGAGIAGIKTGILGFAEKKLLRL